MILRTKPLFPIPYQFIVEGNIGAGKSTFVKLMHHALGIHAVYEPSARWQSVHDTGNLLELFYQHPARWAYTLQTYAFVTRLLEQKEHAQQYPHHVQLVERSVFSDRYIFAKHAFELGYMTTLEWQLYQEWFSWLIDTYVSRPTGFIYLQTTPSNCSYRIKQRNRPGEHTAELSYLDGIHQKHEDWLIYKRGIAGSLYDVPVLVLSCDIDFERDIKMQREYSEQVYTFIQQYTQGAIQSMTHASLNL